MITLSVKQWLDLDTKEADLQIRTEKTEFSVFAPQYTEPKTMPITLYALFAEDIVLSEQEPDIRKLDEPWSYHIVGTITCMEPPCVKLCDDIYIAIDGHIPKDLKAGDTIEFHTSRLSYET